MGGQNVDVLNHRVVLAGLAAVLLRGVSGGLSQTTAEVGLVLAGERPRLLQVGFEVFLHLVLGQTNRAVGRVVQALQATVRYWEGRRRRPSLTEEFLLGFLVASREEHLRASSSASIQHLPAAFVGARNMR